MPPDLAQRVALIAAARRADTSRFRVFSGIFDDAERTGNAGSRRQPISENRRQPPGKTPYRTRSERSVRVFRCPRYPMGQNSRWHRGRRLARAQGKLWRGRVLG